MKVAMIVPKAPRIGYGGPGNVQKISEKLAEMGFEMEILGNAPDPKETAKIKNVTIKEFWGFAPKDCYFFSPGIFLELLKGDYDIIHCNGFNNLSTFSGFLAKKKWQKLVLTPNCTAASSGFRQLLWGPYTAIMKPLSKRLDKLICVSENEKDFFLRKLKLPENKYIVIPNAIGADYIKKVKAGKKKDVIITIGRLIEKKGFQHIIRAFGIVARDRPEFKLYLVGGGPYEAELKKVVAELGIGEKVSFLGSIPPERRDELIKLLKESRLFVFMSPYESQGMVVGEAIAAGLPCVVANKAGVADYVKKGYAVGVENPADEKEIAKKIEMVLKEPGKYMHEDAEFMDWDDVAREIAKVYKEIAGKK